jgi:hypothetical protein
VTAFSYSIACDVFQRLTECMRVVVIPHTLANGRLPQALLDLLRETEATERAQGEAGAHARRHVQNEPAGAFP